MSLVKLSRYKMKIFIFETTSVFSKYPNYKKTIDNEYIEKGKKSRILPSRTALFAIFRFYFTPSSGNSFT